MRVFPPSARSRRPRSEPPVQLARFGEARWQRLHRDKPWVWDGDLHHRLPHEHREAHHGAGQHRPVSDGAGGHQTGTLPRDGVPETDQQQQQTCSAAALTLTLRWSVSWHEAMLTLRAACPTSWGAHVLRFGWDATYLLSGCVNICICLLRSLVSLDYFVIHFNKSNWYFWKSTIWCIYEMFFVTFVIHLNHFIILS